MRVLSRQEGFTLLELILTIAVASIVMLAIGAVLTSHTAMSKDAQNRAVIQTDLQMCSDALTEVIKALPKETDFSHVAGTDVYLFESSTVKAVISFFEIENRLEIEYYEDGILLRAVEYANIHSFAAVDNKDDHEILTNVKITLTADNNGKFITLETDVGLRNNRGI